MTRAAAVAIVVLSGCAGASASSSPGTTGAGNSTGSAASTGQPGGTLTGSAGATGTRGGGGSILPPEMELESSYEVPVATGHFIWVANPLSGRVAYVDASTLDVHTVEAGNAPTYMSPIPSTTDDAVIVLNVLSDDATVLRVGGTAPASRTIAGVSHGANAVAVSPDGSWALAWTDARRVANATSVQGFQDVTAMDIRTATAKPRIVAVGYRPVSVAFTADGSRAFAVTQDGITVIDLAAQSGPRVTRNVPLTDDSTENADTRDVSITPAGTLAVIRREGSASIGIVDLATGFRSSIDLSGPVTDLDLTDDGKRAVAVVRDTAEVAVLPLDAGAPTAAAVTHVTIAGETVGSVVLAPGGQTALLYSNATALERLTVLTLGATTSYRVVKLHAPVLSAFPTAGAHNAVVLHAAAPATPDGGASVDAGAPLPLVAANAFSLVPLDDALPALIASTDALPQSVALAPTGDRALVTVRDDAKKIYGVYMGLFPTLEVQHFPLASPPIAVGVVAAATRGFVAQKHPEGRITFVTLDSGEARTLTGFELGARVVDWSQP